MSHHRPFKSLGTLSWPTDISPHLSNSADDSSSSTLTKLFTNTFADAQLLIDSIPTPTQPIHPTAGEAAAASPGRARSHTDSGIAAASPFPLDENATIGSSKGAREEEKEKERETVDKLRREWKDLKLAAQQQSKSNRKKNKEDDNNNNPHQITVYKMSAKDGGGSWFARRSLHRAGGFDKWEAAFRREMTATLERVEATPGKEPGTGNIRGIGAERRVDGAEVEGGTMDVYHVSARFPGPTTPRDFVTLIMMPKEREKKGEGEEKQGGKPKRPRQFMLVSRPCEHPDCPPRREFVRGTYESVEVIREVPIKRPLRRARSSIDLNRDEPKGEEPMSKEAMLRAAKQTVGDDGDAQEMAIEWLMVTRSDPGGSVPRFMVEKGTPGGIINDAGRFLDWLSSQTREELTGSEQPAASRLRDAQPTEESPVGREKPGQLPANASAQDHFPNGGMPQHHEGTPGSSNNSSRGIFGMLSSVLGTASSAVANGVAAFAPASIETDGDESGGDTDDDDDDDKRDVSNASFTSADEGGAASARGASLPGKDDVSVRSSPDSAEPGSETATSQTLSCQLTPSSIGRSPTDQSRQDKELSKLRNRVRKAQEKLERAEARHHRAESEATTDAKSKDKTKSKEKEKDDQALAKLRDKHERETARLEDKYRRELRRLADKRAAGERKAEERRRKAVEREQRRLRDAKELEHTQAERDVARGEVEMLRDRVGELQRQNTRLVARLGKQGVNVDGLRDVL
ncbi:reticulocyte-binding protein 2 a [Corynascus novoguineensis]|uniref:Reticulocyte-binding protein 2 a n=1 Tax=Corynascus novoguineensis TaxID=1126955 RepID=A0AAN7D3T9_9PEZI|nr:reticulocyte-binding protein 2 a [Corynascus novoguineensis]